MLRAGVGGPRSGEASGGPGALQAATLPPPRHSSAGGSSKQQPLAREHTAAHLCCGGNKAATPRPGLPLEGLGQEGRTGAAETVPNAVSEGQPRGGQHPSLAREFRSAGAAPRSAQCSVGARDRRAPSWCPSVSSPGSTTPAFLDERPRKLVLSSSREHDLRRSATQRSPLFKKGPQRRQHFRSVGCRSPLLEIGTSAARLMWPEANVRRLRQRRVPHGGAGRALCTWTRACSPAAGSLFVQSPDRGPPSWSPI